VERGANELRLLQHVAEGKRAVRESADEGRRVRSVARLALEHVPYGGVLRYRQRRVRRCEEHDGNGSVRAVAELRAMRVKLNGRGWGNFIYWVAQRFRMNRTKQR
jgi:hypothetical protein